MVLFETSNIIYSNVVKFSELILDKIVPFPNFPHAKEKKVHKKFVQILFLLWMFQVLASMN